MRARPLGEGTAECDSTEPPAKLVCYQENARVNLDSILSALRSERDRLNAAISALEDVAGSARRPTKTRRHMSAAARRKISLAQKARWAKQRKAAKAA